tara:strand:+ start:1060 stop:1332 length:273 start_codon:yes stop_codon:yes gene_type:complete
MGKLVLEDSKHKILEWNGSDYKLRKPCMLESLEYHKQYQKIDKNDAYDLLNLSITFLDKLGLPKKVAHAMEPSHITAILTFLNEADTEGK